MRLIPQQAAPAPASPKAEGGGDPDKEAKKEEKKRKKEEEKKKKEEEKVRSASACFPRVIFHVTIKIPLPLQKIVSLPVQTIFQDSKWTVPSSSQQW